ncbi:MAG TPA: methyltransferase [Chloroflexota bacterium]
MNETAGDVVTVRLGEFDNHGTTRARIGGRWIEIEHGVPGETVKAELMGEKRQRGRIVDLVKAANDRVFPPCEYFREWACGGCQWQHISYRSQLRRKRRAIEDAMNRAGLDLSVTGTHALDDPWRYRSTAGISLGRHAGFRRHGSLAIVPIRDCLISHPLISSLMARLNDLINAGDLPNLRGRVRLEVSVADGPVLQIAVRLDADRPPPSDDVGLLTSTLAGLEDVAGLSLLSLDGSLDVLRGEPFAPTTIADRPVFMHAGSFFQTNLLLLPQLIARLQQEAAPLAGKRVADVYGGVGVFGLFLALDAAEATIIEADPLAEEACRRTTAAWRLDNVRFRAEEAETALRDAGSFDVVVLDPPRTGLSDPVIESLVEGAPSTILYVSCLAQSLARDLHVLMAEGYTVEHLELFDFYPQTYHVEVLAVLRREE